MEAKDDRRLDEELRRARPASEFPKERILARIRGTIASGETAPARPPGTRVPKLRSAGRAALLVAAALTIFVLGAEYGRRTAGVAPGAETGPVALKARELPLLIQSHGSEYVASLAGLAAGAESLSPEQRRLAEEVALTVLHAAIVELSRAADYDPALQSAAGLVSTRRSLLQRQETPSADREGNG